MNLRTKLLVALVVVPAALLLAFGPRGAVDVPPERVIVRYWEKWTGSEEVPIRRIVDDFNRTVGARRGIWVELVSVSNVAQRTLIATAGGDPPDIAGLYDWIVPQYAELGALEPLDAPAREAGIPLDALKPIWLKICRYRGTLYALPSTPYTVALYYNRRLFRKAGLDPDRPPRTIAELDAFAERLTRRDASGRIVQLGFSTAPSMLGWWPWIWPKFFGATLWDGRHCRIDTPQIAAALTWIRQRRRRIGLEALRDFEAAAGVIEGAQNPFLSGRLAMVFQGPWLARWAAIYTPQLDYAVAPFPSAVPGRRFAFASSDVFVIPRGARHPREAMVFLSYLMQQPVFESLCKAHGKVSPFRDPGPDFFRGHPNPYIRVFDALALSPDVFGFPPMPMWAQVLDELIQLIEQVQRGQRGVTELLPQAQQRIDRIVDHYWQMAARRHATLRSREPAP